MGMAITTKPHRGRGRGSVPSATSEPTQSARAAVIPINDSAALFMALAADIRGTAVGLSPAALELLRHGLEIRFGHVLDDADGSVFDRLVQLASTPAALSPARPPLEISVGERRDLSQPGG